MMPRTKELAESHVDLNCWCCRWFPLSTKNFFCRPACSTEVRQHARNKTETPASPLTAKRRSVALNTTEAPLLPDILRCRWRSTAVGATSIALLSCGFAAAEDRDGDDAHRTRTATPIKHVIVLIGENWSFDSVYATYKPKHDQSVGNLLSRGVVREDGTPGPNFNRSMQFVINQPYPATFFIDAKKTAGKTATSRRRPRLRSRRRTPPISRPRPAA